ncbi:uncharacterized protein LOC141856961 [Brevipalpus obovatus]|uniref:uncharacterized protein LOC141856961 n=1 Tax=Brevipalpus obovatus TaxID=246614 RepID=UPI003D9EBF3B
MKFSELLLFQLFLLLLEPFLSITGYYVEATEIGGLKPPRIIEHPTDIVVRRQEPATLGCKAEGNPKPVTDWYKDGKKLAKNRSNSNRMILPTGDLFFLHVIPKKDSDLGTYWCEARNEIGKAVSRKATVNFAFFREEFRSTPVSQNIISGELLILNCTPPRGYPEPKIAWKKDGRLLDPSQDSRIKILPGGGLILEDVQPKDEGRYSCIAENMVGFRETPPAIVKVSVKPKFIIKPEDISASEGEDVRFSCQVAGDPAPYITWTKKDGKLAFDRIQIREDKTLEIREIRPSDEGIYICEAVNQGGTLYTSARLTINYFREEFRSVPKSENAIAGDRLILNCTPPRGFPEPKIAWKKDGQFLYPATDTRINILPGGDLKIENVQTNDQGRYNCIAENIVGLRESPPATVKVLVKPKFTVKPNDVTVMEGDDARFECKATGDPPPQITWTKKGGKLPIDRIQIRREDKTLEIRDVGSSDDGIYICEASNQGGIASASSRLIINSPSKQLSSPKDLPSRHPEHLHISAINNSVIHLSWKPLDTSAWGTGQPMGYLIQILSKDTWFRDIFNTSLQAHEVYIHNLTEGETYDVQLAAFNSLGSGPYSPSVPLHMVPGYVYSKSSSSNSSASSSSSPSSSSSSSASSSLQNDSILAHNSNQLTSFTRDPTFILSALVSMFLISALIFVIFARRHLNWKKSVANYLTVQLSKCDELEKCGLNGMIINSNGANGRLLLANGNSSLPGASGPGGVGGKSSGSLSSSGGSNRKTSWLASNFKYGSSNAMDSSGKVYSLIDTNYHKHQYSIDGNDMQMNQSDTSNRANGCITTEDSEYAIADDEVAYYAEVEGHSMVTFGKKGYSSTAPYATTTLMNSFRGPSSDKKTDQQPPPPPPPQSNSVYRSQQQQSLLPPPLPPPQQQQQSCDQLSTVKERLNSHESNESPSGSINMMMVDHLSSSIQKQHGRGSAISYVKHSPPQSKDNGRDVASIPMNGGGGGSVTDKASKHSANKSDTNSSDHYYSPSMVKMVMGSGVNGKSPPSNGPSGLFSDAHLSTSSVHQPLLKYNSSNASITYQYNAINSAAHENDESDSQDSSSQHPAAATSSKYDSYKFAGRKLQLFGKGQSDDVPSNSIGSEILRILRDSNSDLLCKQVIPDNGSSGGSVSGSSMKTFHQPVASLQGSTVSITGSNNNPYSSSSSCHLPLSTSSVPTSTAAAAAASPNITCNPFDNDNRHYSHGLQQQSGQHNQRFICHQETNSLGLVSSYQKHHHYSPSSLNGSSASSSSSSSHPHSISYNNHPSSPPPTSSPPPPPPPLPPPPPSSSHVSTVTDTTLSTIDNHSNHDLHPGAYRFVMEPTSGHSIRSGSGSEVDLNCDIHSIVEQHTGSGRKSDPSSAGRKFSNSSSHHHHGDNGSSEHLPMSSSVSSNYHKLVNYALISGQNVTSENNVNAMESLLNNGNNGNGSGNVSRRSSRSSISDAVAQSSPSSSSSSSSPPSTSLAADLSSSRKNGWFKRRSSSSRTSSKRKKELGFRTIQGHDKDLYDQISDELMS